MSGINFYQKKYEALETFYGWIDQGSAYDVAVEQSIYYNHSLDEIDEIIFNITIAIRFSRSGRVISDTFKKRLENVILKYKSLDLKKYFMSDEEKMVLCEEIEEVKELIMM